jgi:hypothetical protein
MITADAWSSSVAAMARPSSRHRLAVADSLTYGAPS